MVHRQLAVSMLARSALGLKTLLKDFGLRLLRRPEETLALVSLFVDVVMGAGTMVRTTGSR